MTHRAPNRALRPLGKLAPLGKEERWSADNLPRSPELAVDLRQRIAEYLGNCPVFLAWMEYTRDGIGDRFGVDGGSAIVSDGVYYWRADAGDYVREYGIPVPRDAIRHFESKEWRPPVFQRTEYLRIYQELDDLLGGGEVVG